MKPTFLWGAATSAHQVEGGNVHSDWWKWEKETRGKEQSGRAADHYNKYKEDFELAKKLGHNAHRLSIEWARIEPTQGKWDMEAVAHYRAVFEELKKQELKIFLTLHHFTNPQWVAAQGGWTNSKTVDCFAKYVEFVASQYGDIIDFWVTINEPMVYASQSFWHAKWPPGMRRASLSLIRVVLNMAAAHRRAYRILHRHLPKAQVGIAKHLVAFLYGERMADLWFNHAFWALTKGTHDYLGVNYYFSSQWEKWTGARSDLQWPINPHGFTHVLKHAAEYKLPIYITENGLADSSDSIRPDFIRDHLRAVEEAQKAGADVRGYLHWSLLDNFEWADGFGPRFGLIEVDYETLERKPRPSAYVYKAIIEGRNL